MPINITNKAHQTRPFKKVKLPRRFFAKILERYGDYEISEKFLFSVTPGQRLNRVINNIERSHRDGEWSDVDDGYWFDCNLYFPMEYTEIPEEEYQIMRKYLGEAN